jgi:CheY-like chemotaxis protein
MNRATWVSCLLRSEVDSIRRSVSFQGMCVERRQVRGDLSCLGALGEVVLAELTRRPQGPLPWRILIVEDDPIFALDLSNIVTSAGMVVVGAVPTILAAQRVIEDDIVDAAVLDIRLESGDTLEFAMELRARNLPFLFQTADPRLVDGFVPPPIVLAKPFTPERLIAALRELLSNSFS